MSKNSSRYPPKLVLQNTAFYAYVSLVGLTLTKSSILTKAPGPPASPSSSRRTVLCCISFSSAAVDDLPRDTVNN